MPSTFPRWLRASRADELDPNELSRLSDELQIKLFGAAATGEVTLLLFEGPVDVIRAFVALDNSVALRGLAEPGLLPKGGRLSQVREGGAVVPVARGPAEPERPAQAPDRPAPGDAPVYESDRPERFQGGEIRELTIRGGTSTADAAETLRGEGERYAYRSPVDEGRSAGRGRRKTLVPGLWDSHPETQDVCWAEGPV